MTYTSTFASRIAAATSALVLSLVLISGTVVAPTTAQASTYVGIVA